jgi:hypothetical protein
LSLGDYALTRPESDPAKIALAGWSFGGFLAPRAASFEHRIAALVADPDQWDECEGFLRALPLTDEQIAMTMPRPRSTHRSPEVGLSRSMCVGLVRRNPGEQCRYSQQYCTHKNAVATQ